MSEILLQFRRFRVAAALLLAALLALMACELPPGSPQNDPYPNLHEYDRNSG
jgi:hypothetical protein